MNAPERKDMATMRITAINPTSFPDQDLCKMACKACAQLFSALGFSQISINIGKLGTVVEQESEQSAILLNDERFHAEAEVIEEDGAKKTAGEKRANESKISIDEMFKGIDLKRTAEDK